ncbi:hypothetical protein CH296_24910 [Rhodococcus sp. 14-2496-1d]|nr:hypothetical protein CH296_24910 [Rhodococcus sp. 14-2496-1d]
MFIHAGRGIVTRFAEFPQISARLFSETDEVIVRGILSAIGVRRYPRERRTVRFELVVPSIGSVRVRSSDDLPVPLWLDGLGLRIGHETQSFY